MDDIKDFIKAWAEGETVQYLTSSRWLDVQDGHYWYEYEVENYRIRPSSVSFSMNFSFPRPEIFAPERGTKYFIPDVVSNKNYSQYIWYGNAYDEENLRNGIVHLESSHAIEHTIEIKKMSRTSKVA